MSDVSLFYPNKSRNIVKKLSLSGVEPSCIIELQTVDGSVALSNKKASNSLFGVLTDVKISRREAASITPTIGNHLFIYVGGESYYTIVASGIAFNKRCDKDKSEINDLVSYYTDNNVKQTGKFGRILIGDTVYKGYLTEFFANCSSDSDSYFTFTLNFWAITE